MSSGMKWVVSFIVLGAVGGFLWWSGWLKPPQQPTQTTETATTTPSGEEAPLNGMSASNNVSNNGLDQDAAAIDVQMQALSVDTANVDASLSDKPVTQSY